jgi:hypothetical protein
MQRDLDSMSLDALQNVICKKTLIFYGSLSKNWALSDDFDIQEISALPTIIFSQVKQTMVGTHSLEDLRKSFNRTYFENFTEPFIANGPETKRTCQPDFGGRETWEIYYTG